MKRGESQATLKFIEKPARNHFRSSFLFGDSLVIVERYRDVFIGTGDPASLVFGKTTDRFELVKVFILK